MNYRSIYMRIISHARMEMQLGIRPQTKALKNKYNTYYEFHHILPKSLFSLWSSRQSNLVALTAREHFFCHQLLYKIYPCKEMVDALWLMYHKYDGSIKNSLDYERVKEAEASYKRSLMLNKPKSREAVMKSAKSRTGVKRSDEQRERMRQAQLAHYKDMSAQDRIIQRNHTKTEEQIQKEQNKQKQRILKTQQREQLLAEKARQKELKLKKKQETENQKKLEELKKQDYIDCHKNCHKKWYNNGITNILCYEDEATNLNPGRIKNDYGKANKGKTYYTDGTVTVFSFACPEGFYPGQANNHTSKGLKWYNNGTNQIMAKECPPGYKPGMCNMKHSEKALKSCLGKHPYNNGIKQIYAFECPEGFTPGPLPRPKGKHHYNNGIIDILAYECPEGFVKGKLNKLL